MKGHSQMKNINLKVLSLFLVFFTTMVAAQKKEEEKTDTIKSTSKVSYKKLQKEGNKKEGLFNIYRLKEDIYFEIPDSLLSKDFLIVNKISQVPYEFNGYGLNKGMAYETKLIRFYKDTLLNKVWVKTINPRVTSPKNNAITRSVRNNFGESIIEGFKIESENEKKTSAFIKVNRIFNGEDKSFNDLFSNLGLLLSVKTKLSKIDELKTFSKNIVVKSLFTTSVKEGNRPVLQQSIGVTTNIVLLPTNIMKPRFGDKRIGYFSKPMDYYSDSQHEVEHRELITRWRLEPKKEDIERYKKGELVIPKKQIVYYIDPATPKKWISYIENGVYDWNKAFEQAGFKNAVVVKQVTKEDKDFDIDDVRYSVITYVASERQNAMGPSIVDPRSGEILESDIIWWHNLMKGLHQWIRVQTGPINLEARANVFSDEIMGESIKFVSSHEVGHTFGLKHNMGASFSYPVDSLRSASFTKKMGGTAPSIMDYARYNYVAQPGDNVTEISPKIGVYDKYAINWGYRWLEGKTPHEELPILNQWIRKHENDPLYFYGPQQRNIIDPRSQSEDLGDNAVKASEYGLENLRRIVPNIIKWTYEEGEDYYKAAKLYKAVIDQWQLYSGHVMANIGGIYINNTIHGDGKNTFVPVPTKIQKEALDYIIKETILPQKWLFAPDLIHKVYPVRDAPDGERFYSPISMHRAYQTNMIYRLIETDRLMRIIENKVLASDKNDVFTEEYLFNELFEAIFKKTINNKPIDMFDRMTQKNYVDVLTVDRNILLKKTKETNLKSKNFKNVHFSYIPRVSDVGSNKRAELERILKLLKRKRKKGDKATQNHYNDLIARIEYNLNN
ncbi:zinc-dependent metalloprotease [Tenacibaculum sp. 1_MG-2023]|uniref:zinc-dependent metalloprotease n=1 Tax=Tenacibaculum sp. 1_MG-2023 TaxID=3062653 RepID=UPI0026E295DD|nr:zinc-dependent metalloprotease [Tenacibaculum sp. 1_MG-2023]MDO6676159.1 zinc-dependent metalloprotease [Tenacibaculum sp. 1_MG-2023]